MGVVTLSTGGLDAISEKKKLERDYGIALQPFVVSSLRTKVTVDQTSNAVRMLGTGRKPHKIYFLLTWRRRIMKKSL